MPTPAKASATSQASKLATSAPYLVVFILICLVWGWHVQFLGIGMIRHFDEFYTYERSISFARMDDWWAVYSANKPTLKKPPMQYWMIGGLFELGLRDVIALRLPSMIFAAFTLGATALLARSVAPGKPWVMVGAVLLLASSQTFWDDATSAMLDVGAALFVTLGLIAMLAAFRDPRYWPVFALTVFLGGMQKGPIALAFLVFALLALAITAPLQTRRIREIVWNRRFFGWFFVSLVLAFAWQLYMGLRFPGEDAIQGSIENEMFERFAPTADKIGAYSLAEFQRLILGREPWLRTLGIIGLIALPFTSRNPLLLSLTGVVLIFILVMMISTEQVYPRYMLVVLPLLAVGLAAFLATILRSDFAGLVASIALCFLFGGPLTSADRLDLDPANRDGVSYADIMTPVRENLKPDEALLICEMDQKMRFPRGAYTVYAAGTGPITRLRDLDVADALARENYTGGPIRGLCTQGELGQIQDQMREVETTPLLGGHIQFTAAGLATDG